MKERHSKFDGEPAETGRLKDPAYAVDEPAYAVQNVGPGVCRGGAGVCRAMGWYPAYAVEESAYAVHWKGTRRMPWRFGGDGVCGAL